MYPFLEISYAISLHNRNRTINRKCEGSLKRKINVRFHHSGETARPLCLLALTCEDIYNGDEPTIETNLKRHNIPESDYGQWIENCIRYFSTTPFINAHCLLYAYFTKQEMNRTLKNIRNESD